MKIITDNQEVKRLVEDLNGEEFEQKNKVSLTDTQYKNAWTWPAVYGERD